MSEYQVKRHILSECTDKNGFVVKLRTHQQFDDERYQQLYKNIAAYADILGFDDYIDRSVMACLFETWTTITIASGRSSESEHPDQPKVDDAHAEVSCLLHDRIFLIKKAWDFPRVKYRELKSRIVPETIDEEGFLTLLHASWKFDEAKYRHLVDNISAYAEALADDDDVDRDVAACLFEIWTAITARATLSEADYPLLPRVQNAYSELEELLQNKVFISSKPT